ncbi:MAG: WD40 repeat [Glomeribacter sp. 1016415]|nr:WD40 repeat [Glomeribacter sp. 1016415]
MLPISSLKIPQTSKTSTPSNLLTQIDASHEQANEEGQSIVQASENCVVSNQLYGESHTVTTNFFLTASDSNTKLIFEKLNGHAEATRYKPLAQLGTHIEDLRAAYLNVLEEVNEIRDGLTLYIPSAGQETADSQTSFPLIDKVREFLSSTKKVLLLLGEAGSGKSTFNRHLTRMLWDEYQQSSTIPIPVFIALAEHIPSREDLIESYLLEQEFSPEAIALLRKEKRLIFILDGFDEIQDRTQAFYTQNKLDRWRSAQVIISSRPEYLGENYRSQFQKRGQTSTLQEYWLSPISDDWITAYIQKYIQHTQRTGWNLKRYQDTLNNLPTLKEAIRRPFLLRMALDLLPDLAESKSAPMTRIALYDAFILRWWNRSEERLQHITLTDEEEKARRQLGQHLVAKGLRASQEMAIALTQKRLIQASYDREKEEIIPEAWQTYLDENEVEKRLLLFNAPLIHQGQHYRFIHKSIQDYCVARAICGPQFNSYALHANAVLNQYLLVNEPLILDFLVERVEQHTAFKAYLYAWIEASKDPHAPVSVGAANAITILVRAGVQFNGADLKGIRIVGADLSDGVFDSAQLQGADLTEAKLRNIWLRQANLNGAQMVGVQFGEWPALQEESSVRACAYSPDGKSYAVGLGNSGINVYDSLNWKKIWTLRGHTSGVYSVAYSPRGDQIASGSYDHTVRLWSAETGQPGYILRGHNNFVNSVAYSPKGDQIASGGGDCTVRLWSVETGKLSRILRGHTGSVYSVAYSPKGDQIASGSCHHTVRLWSVETGKLSRILRSHTGSVNSVAYSPKGDQIASGGNDHTVRLWSVETGQLSRILRGHTREVNSVAYSPKGDQVASVSYDRTVCLWSVETGQLSHILRGHTGSVYSVAYSPKGDQVASGSYDRTVRLWSVGAGQLSRTLPGYTHTGSVNSVAYSPKGGQIASGSDDSTVRLWSVETGQLSRILRGHTRKVNSVAYSPKGDQIASGSDDQTLQLWSVETGQSDRTLLGHIGWVHSVMYSPKGNQIASGGNDRTVRLWSVETGQPGYILRGHTGSVYSVAYSPKGDQIASGSLDKTVRLWSVETGQPDLILRGHTGWVWSVAYSPQGDQIASGSEDGTVRLWSIKTRQPGHTLHGHTSGVWSVVYSPQGDQIASGSEDNTVRLWEVKTGQCQVVIEDFNALVKSVAWETATNGNYLVTGSKDLSVCQWKVMKENGYRKVQLCWSSTHVRPNVRNISIEGVQGLSGLNWAFLEQWKSRFNPPGNLIESTLDKMRLYLDSKLQSKVSDSATVSFEENHDELANISRSFESENVSQNEPDLTDVPTQGISNLDPLDLRIQKINEQGLESGSESSNESIIDDEFILDEELDETFSGEGESD